jgi:hypothetical protein
MILGVPPSSVLLLPKISEALRGELGVPGRVLDVAVPEPLLDRAGVVAIMGELEPTGVPEHVRVDGEGELGLLADAAHELLEAGHGQRARSLAG